MKDGGYQLKIDAVPFQAAKASGEIISDVREFTADIVQYISLSRMFLLF